MLLKTIIGLLALVAHHSVYSAHVPEPRDIDSNIKNAILAELRKISDPLVITNKDITIPQNDYVSGTVTINSASISGISAGEVPLVTCNVLELKLHAQIEFESLIINATLREKISVNSTDFDNDVTANISLKQLLVDISGKYVVLKGHIHSLKVKATLDSSNFQLTGLLNNDLLSSIIAETLSSNLANWINNDTTIFLQLSTYLENVINAYLDSQKAFTHKLDSILAPYD